MTEKVPIRNDLFKEGKTGAILLANKCTACGQIFSPGPNFA